MDYETLAHYTARTECDKLIDSARKAGAPRVRTIIGIQVTAFADGSTTPAVSGLVRAHMARRNERNARPR